MRFTCLSASITKAFAFSLVGGHNACVSHACLHLLGRLLRGFFIVLQCMRFTLVSAPVKTAFAIFFVSRYNGPWYGVTMHAFHTRLCIY